MATDNVSEPGELTDVYYMARSGTHTFQILKVFSDTHTQYSLLDSRGRDCVHAVVQSRHGTNRAYLSQITYRPTCAIGETMARGQATINMVNALLVMVMRDTNFDRMCVARHGRRAFQSAAGIVEFRSSRKNMVSKTFRCNTRIRHSTTTDGRIERSVGNTNDDRRRKSIACAHT